MPVVSTHTHKLKRKGQKEMVRIQMPKRCGDRTTFVSIRMFFKFYRIFTVISKNRFAIYFPACCKMKKFTQAQKLLTSTSTLFLISSCFSSGTTLFDHTSKALPRPPCKGENK